MKRSAQSILIAFAMASAAAIAQEASIVFRGEPAASGMELAMRTCGPTGHIQGKEAWVSPHGSVPGDEWARGFFLRVTDPALAGDGAPPVEIEAVFRHPGNTAVELWARTANGFEKVAGGWGNSGEWQTIRASVREPRFGSGGEGEADVLVKAWAADFAVHSVVVRDASPANPANWARFVTVASVSSPAEFTAAFGPEASIPVVATLRNANSVAVSGELRWTVREMLGKERASGAVAVALPPEGESEVALSIPAGALPADAYRLRLAFAAAGREGMGDESMVAVAGPEDVFVLFNDPPVTHGIDFTRQSIRPATMEADGATIHYWEADGAQFGSDGWWNSVLFSFEDPRFRDGGRPVTDIRVFKRHSPNAPIWFSADMRSGSERIASGWGNFPGWDIFYARTDTARFSRTPSGIDPKQLPANGVDLRYGACSGPAQIRAIWVRGYDRDGHPDFRRLVRYDGLRADRDMFVFEPGARHSIRLAVSNLARVGFDAVCTAALSTDMEEPISSEEFRRAIPAESDGEIPFTLDATALRLGVYRLAIEVRDASAPDAGPVFSRTAMVMVSGRERLGKARDGEFLYGVDACLGYTDERFWKWADFMGADILRGFGCDQADEAAMSHAMSLHAKYGFRPYFFMDVGWHDDPAERAALNRRRASLAAGLASRYDPEGRAYWELGNEPDLPFFYPGPPEAYSEGFGMIAAAIHAATPSATVMNGGLCFAGEEGDRRARRIVATIPMEDLDVWAYHGHGPGAAAERNAHKRLAGAIAEAGRDPGRPFAETESGFAASTPAQLRIQARTAVQKLVYAQSAGLRFLMWFRLLIDGGDANYSCLNGCLEEPRPSILAYRTAVANLRHASFVSMLDTSSVPDAEAYFFEEPEKRRAAIVAWTDSSVSMRRIFLGEGASDAVLCDLFGNEEPLAFAAPGTVVAPVTPDPVFLRWRRAAGDAMPSFAASPIHVASPVLLVPDSVNRVAVAIDNAADGPRTLALEVEPIAGGGEIVSATPPAPQRLEAGESATLEIDVAAGHHVPDIRWPRRWRAFFDLPADFDVSSIDSIPSAIGGVKGVELESDARGVIDFAAPGGGIRERAPVLLLAWAVADEDAAVRFGAAADWWMEWFANGRRVFDTLEGGNEGGRFQISDHVFDVPLRKGRNLLAVRVLSGSQGWKLVAGGPAEVAAATGGLSAGAALSIRLRAEDGSLVAVEEAPVRWRRAVADSSSPVLPYAPDFSFQDDVENRFVKEPDARRWWQGPADLSAEAWLRRKGDDVLALLAVRDDSHRPPPSDRISPDDRAGDFAWMLWEGAPVPPVAVERIGDATHYTFRVPAVRKPSLSFLVLDSDDDSDGGFKQLLRSGPLAIFL